MLPPQMYLSKQQITLNCSPKRFILNLSPERGLFLISIQKEILCIRLYSIFAPLIPGLERVCKCTIFTSDAMFSVILFCILWSTIKYPWTADSCLSVCHCLCTSPLDSFCCQPTRHHIKEDAMSILSSYIYIQFDTG